MKLGKLFDLRAVLHCWSLSIRNRAITKASSFCDVSNSSSIQLKCLIWWTEDPVLGEKRFLFLHFLLHFLFVFLSPSCLFSFFLSIRPHSCLFVCVTDRLRLFRHFDPFRILICSGDGSIGWVLSEIDKLHMDVSAVPLFFPSLLLVVWLHQKSDDWAAHTQHTHTHLTTWILSFIVVQKQCQIGVLPLGTGNDLARVIGWGSVCDDDAHLPQLLERYEKASVKMLDRYNSFYTSTYSRSPMTFWNFLFLFVHPGGAFSRLNGACLYLRPKSSCLTSPLPPSRTLSSVTWARSFNRTSTISSSHPPSKWRFHLFTKKLVSNSRFLIWI